jgi:hypothetical protein
MAVACTSATVNHGHQAINIFLHGQRAASSALFMTTHSMYSPTWRTASFPDSFDTTAVDTRALVVHLDVCKRAAGSMFAFRRSAEVVHGFLASRFVTTLTLIAVLIGVSSAVM